MKEINVFKTFGRVPKKINIPEKSSRALMRFSTKLFPGDMLWSRPRHICLSTAGTHNTLIPVQTKTAIINSICQKRGNEKLCAPFPQRKQRGGGGPLKKQTLISGMEMKRKTQPGGLGRRAGCISAWALRRRDGGSAGCAPRLQMPRRGRGHSVSLAGRGDVGSALGAHHTRAAELISALSSVSTQ